jgi:hypothetical protein
MAVAQPYPQAAYLVEMAITFFEWIEPGLREQVQVIVSSKVAAQ